MIRVAPASPNHPDAQRLLARLSETLEALTGSSGTQSFDAAEVQDPRGLFVLAHDSEGRAVGCGAVRPLSPDIGEVKRVFADSDGGRGIGSAIMDHLEGAAGALGYRALWLETRQINARARRFYERRGYRVIANFGRYRGREEAVCFGKSLEQLASEDD